MYANNLLGHVQLLEGMLKTGRLGKVAVLLGTEASRGIPIVVKAPSFPTSSTEDYVGAITGKESGGKKFSALYHYGEVKQIGTLWMADLARRHPDLRFVTVSPGSTRGTEVSSHMPAVRRFIATKVVLPTIGRLLGLSHPLQ